ncbi:Fe-S cluster assembly protein SufB [Patescibacteria group bacterium]|nr:Fe-S cluster assembly protein SufB [Patescibacteria group bacterium]
MNNVKIKKNIHQIDEVEYSKKFKKGLSKAVVESVSADKKEPQWMLEHRLECLQIFNELELPKWGPTLSDLNLNEIVYYAKTSDAKARKWEDVPVEIKDTFDALGILQAEAKYLSGVGAQFESTVVYHKLKKELEDRGVIFLDLDSALRSHEEIVKKYFMKCISPRLHKFAALHGAVWSGGTFLYVPKGVKIVDPLQAYFRMNSANMGQFEHTLIVVEEGAEAHYIEGCSAPRWGVNSLHAGCVEVYVEKSAHFRYSSVENWSRDAYNLNTKRAIIKKDAHMEWVGGNFGSQVTMLYPCSVLVEPGASADHLGVAFAGRGQNQDTGAKVIHAAPNTSSNVVSKSITRNGGISTYRGEVIILPVARNSISNVKCDAIMLGDNSESNTYPKIKIENNTSSVTHEATAGKLNETDIFYLTSRGINESAARSLILNGFINPIAKELPLEYAVEMNRMVELELIA